MLPDKIKHKLRKVKRNLKFKGKHKPGDLLKAYKIKVDNKMRNYGDTDTKKKVIRINKKLVKKDPTHKKRYPELADSIYHEIDHAKHPKKTEKQVYKDTRKAMKRLSRKQKSKLYNKLKK